jgi:acyl carrier protein
MTVEELKAEIADILGIAPEEIGPETGAATLAEWDSMANLRIISLLDEAGDEPLEAEESANLTTFQAVMELARKRGLVDA